MSFLPKLPFQRPPPLTLEVLYTSSLGSSCEVSVNALVAPHVECNIKPVFVELHSWQCSAQVLGSVKPHPGPLLPHWIFLSLSPVIQASVSIYSTKTPVCLTSGQTSPLSLRPPYPAWHPHWNIFKPPQHI